MNTRHLHFFAFYSNPFSRNFVSIKKRRHPETFQSEARQRPKKACSQDAPQTHGGVPMQHGFFLSDLAFSDRKPVRNVVSKSYSDVDLLLCPGMNGHHAHLLHLKNSTHLLFFQVNFMPCMDFFLLFSLFGPDGPRLEQVQSLFPA